MAEDAGKAGPGCLGGEGGAGKPVQCVAHAFSDPEMGGALEKAGGLGMLGHRFYRQTTVNWCAAMLWDAQEGPLHPVAASSSEDCPACQFYFLSEQTPSKIADP